MSKLSFRADDDLVERVNRLDASKSEVMRDALRAYLDEETPEEETTNDRLAEQIDAIVADRLERAGTDVNVTVRLEGEPAGVEIDGEPVPIPSDVDPEPRSASMDPGSCPQCGESVEGSHVYCPNCGEKQSRRLFCECGDEVRSDWSYCPGCGRRTPAADVLDGPDRRQP